MKVLLILPVAAALFLGCVQSASAQFDPGGVDMDGTWHIGEGLKHGDYFSYTLCHIDYKECAEFGIDFWIKGDVQREGGAAWLAEAVVYDGDKIIRGELELGKVVPEPIGGTDNLSDYRYAFRSSIVWLSAFATADTGISSSEGPKEFRAPSWGAIGFGAPNPRPTLIEAVTVPSGTWEAVQLSWMTGNMKSKAWIVDGFPFPVRAEMFRPILAHIPVPEYRFSLVEYREGVQQSPFEGIVPTSDPCTAPWHDDSDRVVFQGPTNDYAYQVHVSYWPPDPVWGCEMHWLFKFADKYDDTELLNHVQFDLVVDEDQSPRSIAQEQGREFLYSPSGQHTLDMIVKEDPGIANYTVYIYGLAPDWKVPAASHDFLKISVPISAGGGGEIPSWVKASAGWWADGAIDDESFVGGIQFLIEQGIVTVPDVAISQDGKDEISSRIKASAGWWADGIIDDDSFVQLLQYMIKRGILDVP